MSAPVHKHHSAVYDFFFHPLRGKEKRAPSIIVNIALTILTAGLWQIPFWVINRLDNMKIRQRKSSEVDVLEPLSRTNSLGLESLINANPAQKNLAASGSEELAKVFDECKKAVKNMNFNAMTPPVRTIVLKDLEQLYEEAKIKMNSAQGSKEVFEELSARLRDLVGAVAYHLRETPFTHSPFPRKGIRNYDSQRCFFISGLQTLVHTRLADYAWLRPVPIPEKPEALKKPTLPAEPTYLIFDDPEPEMTDNVKKHRNQLDQLIQLREHLGQGVFNACKLLQSEVSTFEEFQKNIKIANLYPYVDEKALKEIYDEVDAYEKEMSTHRENVNKHNAEIDKQAAGYEKLMDEFERENNEYEDKIRELKDAERSYPELIKFQTLLKEVIEELRKGRSPEKSQIDELGTLCGVFKQGKFGGTDPGPLYDMVNRLVLPGCEIKHNTIPEDVDSFIKRGECSAWICGNGGHVWNYVHAVNGVVYEINDNMETQKAKSVENFTKPNRCCNEMIQ